MKRFEPVYGEIISHVNDWEIKLSKLPEEIITTRYNKQNRNVKQITGHMIDSASNNTHRVIHLQYQPNPSRFPDYANLGINDKWIAIQNYKEESWDILVYLWKYTNLHLAHVIKNVDDSKLQNVWVSALNEEVSLDDMIMDYPRHLKLHLREIEELLS